MTGVLVLLERESRLVNHMTTKDYKYLYFKEKLDNIISRDHVQNDTLLERMVRLSPDGMILEFGVFTGSTINRISSVTSRQVYGFDSFEGLPEDWVGNMNKGYFACEMPDVNPNVTLIKGFFDTSLLPFLEKNTDVVGFCHIDCDLYSSSKYVLDTLSSRFQNGTLILFDELACYQGYEQYEYRAFLEFLCQNDFDFEYVGRRTNESFGVRLIK